MARPPCSNCGEHEAVAIMTIMETGDTEAPCEYCLPGFALAVTAQVTEGISAEQSEAYGALFDQIAANDARSHGNAKPARGGGKRTKSAPVANDATGASPPSDTPDGASTQTARTALTGNQATTTVVALDPPCIQCGAKEGIGDDIKLMCEQCGLIIATIDDSQG